MKVIDTLSATREHLGLPSPDILPDNVLLNALYTAIDFYRIKLGLVNQNWVANEVFLTVDSQSNEYVIAENIGKVLKVEFYDQNYPWRNGPEIRTVHLQDTDLVQYGDDYWWWNTASLPTDGYTEGSYVAAAIAFYGTPTKCRIIPRPTQQAQYRIWHDQMVIAIPKLSEKPGLMETFHRMLPLYMANSCIGKCGKDPKEVQVLGNSLGLELAKWEKLFDEFLRYRNHPQTGMRRAFIPGQQRRR